MEERTERTRNEQRLRADATSELEVEHEPRLRVEEDMVAMQAAQEEREPDACR